MTIGLLIVTHSDIGSALVNTAVHMMGVCPLQTEVLPVPGDADLDELRNSARQMVAQLDQDDGVLILTDMYGSTPSNIANSVADNDHVRVVAGMNLPMLIRVLNYPRLSLPELVSKALSGGRDGVLLCKPTPSEMVNGTPTRDHR